MLVLDTVFGHQFSWNQGFYINLLKYIFYLKFYMAKKTTSVGRLSDSLL